MNLCLKNLDQNFFDPTYLKKTTGTLSSAPFQYIMFQILDLGTYFSTSLNLTLCIGLIVCTSTSQVNE